MLDFTFFFEKMVCTRHKNILIHKINNVFLKKSFRIIRRRMKEQCKNIKSKHYPNIQCPNKVSKNNGEFCAKHIKNPNRFSQKNITSAKIIQQVWKKYSHKISWHRQGPAVFDRTLANNQTEIYSLEKLDTIPRIYFFSFSDTQKNIWGFDIRSLSFLLSKTKIIKNPYTNVLLSQICHNKIQQRIEWLQTHKYPIMYMESNTLTSEQMWNQHVLDVFLKMEESGHIVNIEWFHTLDKEDHIEFYKKLYDIWNYRLGLSYKQKNNIVSGFNSRNKLFKYTLEEINSKEEKTIKKNNLAIIDRLVSSSEKSLGVMYVLMALSYVNNNVMEAHSWILGSLASITD